MQQQALKQKMEPDEISVSSPGTTSTAKQVGKYQEVLGELPQFKLLLLLFYNNCGICTNTKEEDDIRFLS